MSDAELASVRIVMAFGSTLCDTKSNLISDVVESACKRLESAKAPGARQLTLRCANHHFSFDYNSFFHLKAEHQNSMSAITPWAL